MKQSSLLYRQVVGVLFIGLFIGSDACFGQNAIPDVLQRTVAEAFFEGESPSLNKLEDFKAQAEIRKDEIYNNILRFRQDKKGQAPDKAQKKATEGVSHYELLIQSISKLIRMAQDGVSDDKRHEFDRLGLTVLEFDNALKVADKPVSSLRAIRSVKNLFTYQHYLKTQPNHRSEAINLGNQIISGTAIHEILPMSPAFEIHNDISSRNVLRSYTENRAVRGYEIQWPKDAEVKFVEVNKSQSKPKFEVIGLTLSGKEEKYKVKIGAEIHSEPTAGALSATLGYNSDVAKFVKDLKMYYDHQSFVELKRDWALYFAKFDFDSYVSHHGEDQKGKFLVIKNALIEHKLKNHKEIERIGPWHWGDYAHHQLRELRGLEIFNIWIANNDVKEFENNKLLIRKNKSGSLEHLLVQHDQGFSFGHWYFEKPTNFKWQVARRQGDSILFDYRSLQPHLGQNSYTYEDARWMVYKIAQLTRDQIRAAVELGGWPNEGQYRLADLLVEKLISRRNNLVEVLDLIGLPLPDGRIIDHMPFEKFEIKDIPKAIPEFTTDFRPEMKYFSAIAAKALGRTVENVIIDSLAKASEMGTTDSDPSGIDQIPDLMSFEDFGVDSTFIAKVIVKNLPHQIIKNPEPRSDRDLYIIRNDIEVGVRFGGGFVLTGDFAYIRKYSLIYTSDSPHSVDRRRKRFFDAFRLPYMFSHQLLPRNHILISEDFIEKRGRIRLAANPVGINFGPELEGSISRIHIGRTIVSSRELSAGEIQLSVLFDQVTENQHALKAFISLGLVRLKLAEYHRRKGQQNRRIHQVKLGGQNLNGTVLESIASAVDHFDFEALESQSPSQEINSEYVRTAKTYSLFGIRSGGYSKNKVEQEVLDFSGEQPKVSRQSKLKLSRIKKWKFIDNGESRERTFTLVTQDQGTTERAGSLRLVLEDNMTKSIELQKHLKFIDQVSARNNFLSWSPDLHSKNTLWGKVIVEIKILFSANGLSKLLNFPEVKKGDLTKTVKNKAGGFSGKILRQLLERMDPQDFFLEAQIGPPDTYDTKWPEKLTLYNSLGNTQLRAIESNFKFAETEQTYELFNYLMAMPSE